jgi:hypothetical protein
MQYNDCKGKGKMWSYMAPVITLHDQLVSSCNQLEVVSVIKLLRYILKKSTIHKAMINTERSEMHTRRRGGVPVQRCSQLHGERCPNHTCHQGLTTEDHTWDPREAPPAPGQSSLYYQASLSMAIAPHANKISLTLPT